MLPQETSKANGNEETVDLQEPGLDHSDQLVVLGCFVLARVEAP